LNEFTGYGLTALFFLLTVILTYCTVLLYRRLQEAENERDVALDFLQREGLVWSDIAESVIDELAYDEFLDEVDEDSRPGHMFRWDESKTSVQ
jgi:hypothetical protein